MTTNMPMPFPTLVSTREMVELESDTVSTLARICELTGRSAQSVLTLALHAFESDLTKPTPLTRDASGHKSRNLTNGVHTFEIRGCEPSGQYGGSLLLRHIERDRPFDLIVTKVALDAIADMLSKKLNTPVTNTAQLIHNQIDLVVYNGRPTRLPSGEMLS